MSRPKLEWVALGAVLAVLGVHAAHYFPFFSDDALISLRYAQRLCRGLGLTWTDGPPVEGYSDLLWVLLNAPAACLRLEPIWSARVLDFVGAAAAAYIIALPAQPGTAPGTPRVARTVSASLLLVLSAPVAAWAVGGLEHGFMLGVLSLALYFARRANGEAALAETLRASFCFGLLALLRIDGVVLFAAATLGRYATRDGRRAGMRGFFAWCAWPVALLAMQVAFRAAYYHELVPNTAIVKVSFSWFRVQQGLVHVVHGYLPLSLLLVCAVAALIVVVRTGEGGARTLIPLAVALGWPAYVASVGGDIFPAWRQVLLGIVPLSFLVADGAEALLARLTPQRVRVLGVAWLAVLGAHVALQETDSENQRARTELWEWSGRPIGRMLKRAFAAQRPLLAVDAAGALPYWSELPALDMLGLNDHWIPRHPPPGFGRGQIGHELGDADYVWRRSPDIIAFNGAVGWAEPLFTGGQALVARRDFHDVYQIVRVQHRPGSTVGSQYFKREGGPLGLTRSAAQVRIPGYLFAQGEAVARARADDVLCAYAEAEHPAQIERLKLPAGTWRVSTAPADARADLAFVCDGVSPRLGDGARDVLQLVAPRAVDIVIAPPAGKTLALERVVLTRTDIPSEGAQPGFVCDGARSAPLERPLAALDHKASEGSFWAPPGAVRIDRAGLRVVLPREFHPTRVQLMADGNDRYLVRCFRDGRDVGRVLAPVVDGGGLRTRSLALPTTVQKQGVDQLLITPLQGDQAYSVLSVRLVE